MGGDQAKVLGAGDVPEADGLVEAAGREQFAVRRVGDARNGRLVRVGADPGRKVRTSPAGFPRPVAESAQREFVTG